MANKTGVQLQNIKIGSSLSDNDDLIVKMSRARAASADVSKKIARRLSLYEGDGKVINRRTGREVQLECHRNMAYELVESEVSNSIPTPAITAKRPEDVERASRAEDYITQEMIRCDITSINDIVERGTYINGHHWYHVYWDSEAKTNSGWGAVGIREYAADQIWLQPGLKRYQDAEYLFARDTVTVDAIKRLYGIEVPPDDNGLDTVKIVTAWYLDKDKTLGRTIFTESGLTVLAHDPYYELRRVGVCSSCGIVKKELNGECHICGDKKWHYEILKEQTLDEDLLKGNPEQAARMRIEAEQRGEQVDQNYGFEVVAKAGEKVPFYTINELPFVLRINVSSLRDIFGLSDVDRIEQNQDTLNRLTTKSQENLLKAGSFVTYPEGTRIPADDATLKMVPISDYRMSQAFNVFNVQANMQQDDIFAERMYQYGRATLGITESFQGKDEGAGVSGKARQVSAAQSAGRIESKRRMKEAACRDLFRLMFKFELAYCDEVQAYMFKMPTGDAVQRFFSRYDYLERDENGYWRWNDDFVFDVDSSSLISMNRETMWEQITTQYMAGTMGIPTEPTTMKLYWKLMKGYQYPLANAVLTDLEETYQELPYAMQKLILDNPQLMNTLAQMLATQQAQTQGPRLTDRPTADTDGDYQPKKKSGPSADSDPAPQQPIAGSEKTLSTPQGA